MSTTTIRKVRTRTAPRHAEAHRTTADSRAAAHAVQQAMDRRDNGGETGH